MKEIYELEVSTLTEDTKLYFDKKSQALKVLDRYREKYGSSYSTAKVYYEIRPLTVYENANEYHGA